MNIPGDFGPCFGGLVPILRTAWQSAGAGRVIFHPGDLQTDSNFVSVHLVSGVQADLWSLPKLGVPRLSIG